MTLRAYLASICRPWKLVMAVGGTIVFVWGALALELPTWDVGVSILMSVLCWLLAPWAVGSAIAAVRRRPRRWPPRLLASAAVVYFVGSGSYEIYNTIRMGFHPVTYWENVAYSIPVTVIAGVLWQFDGTLRSVT